MFKGNTDLQNLLGGGTLLAIGLFTTIYTATTYDLGTAALMGPGMVPVALGVILSCLGAALTVSALFGPGRPLPSVEWRPLLMIVLAISAFVVTIESLGLVPAIILMNIFAVFADNKIGIPGILILSVLQAAAAVLIFVVGLGIPVQAFKAPF